MSFHAYSYATTKDTGSIALQMTLYVIAMHVNVETGKTYCGVKTLMREAKVKSDRTMRNYLKKLEGLKLIKREKRKRPNGGNSSDLIELVGFVVWNEGRLAGAKNAVVRAPAKNTGGGADKGGSLHPNLPLPPGSHSLPNPPVAHGLPDNVNNVLNENSDDARTRAKNSNSILKEVGAGRGGSLLVITVRAGDVSWVPWLDALTALGERRLRELIERSGALVTATRWPSPGCPLPMPAKLELSA